MRDIQEKRIKLHEILKGRVQSSLSGFLRAFIVGTLVLLQMMIIIILPFAFSRYTLYFYVVLEIFSVLAIIILNNENRSPSYKIAWICIILIFPISGHIMYALWGRSVSKNKLELNVLAKFRQVLEAVEFEEDILKEYEEDYPTKARLPKYLQQEGFPLFKNNQLTYFPMGEDVFIDIFEEIEHAKKFILINFFIIGEGALWDHLHDLLLERIQHGVKVYFLYDDFGALFRTNKNFRRNLEQEGFEVRVFNPIHKYAEKLYMNYRNHEKILVVDGNIGYTGGFNIADEYANLIERFGIWKDNGIKVVGDAVWGLTITFFQMWEACGTTQMGNYEQFKPEWEFEKNQVYCQVISDGPANNPNNPIENAYMQMIEYATKYVYITTPYLVLEDHMKEALIVAAKSGLDVRIITPHIPDKKSVKCLTNYNYGELLKNGIRIYEYTPGFIHAKTILNEDCGIVGTINMDYRSFYLHYECGIVMSDEAILNDIKADFMDCLTECHEVTYEEWKQRPFTLKAYQLLLNMFSTLM